MLYDFHTHTFLSDGVLSPLELIRRAVVQGYSAIAITDHVATGSLTRIVNELREDCALARAHWDILAIPGVEITHVPARAVSEIAGRARELGACLVVVHGETSTEPVEKGTNLAAVQSAHVDILAHPGFLTAEEAALAAKNNVFVELTSRKGHSITNSHVAAVSQKAKARLLVNSDAHTEHELLSPGLVDTILGKSKINQQQRRQIIDHNPLLLIERVKNRL